MSHYINIMGRQVPCHLESVDIDQLRFLPDNPRVYHSTHEKMICSNDMQARIFSSLHSLGSTKELMTDIYQNGGIVEEIIVRNNVVLEGNSRLASYRSLNTRYPDDPRWSHIPAKVIDQDVSLQESSYLLASYHIKGKTAWDAFEKAGFISRTIASLEGDAKSLASQFGHHQSTIIAMADAYNAMTNTYLQKYCSEDDSGKWTEKYSYFEVFYRSKDLRCILASDPSFLDTFCQWIQNDVFPKAEAVRKLPAILRDEKAAATFRNTVEVMPTQALNQAWKELSKHQVALGTDNPIRDFDLFLRTYSLESGVGQNTLSSSDRLRLKRIQNCIRSLLAE